MLGLQQEESRGRVQLRSSVPEEHPSIFYNFLAEESDRVRFRELSRKFYEIFNARPLKQAGCRLIDFASGLTYALDGGMQRVADKVFLLTPRNVEVSAEERARMLERGGFFNQA